MLVSIAKNLLFLSTFLFDLYRVDPALINLHQLWVLVIPFKVKPTSVKSLFS